MFATLYEQVPHTPDMNCDLSPIGHDYPHWLQQSDTQRAYRNGVIDGQAKYYDCRYMCIHTNNMTTTEAYDAGYRAGAFWA